MVHPLAVGFPWQRLAHVPQMRPTKAHDLILRCVRRFREWGIDVPAHSRVGRVERTLRRWVETDDIPRDPGDRARIAEGIRTAVELHMATHGAAGTPTDAALSKCEQVLGGADLPEDEEHHLARDVQLELNVHGTLAAAGLDPFFDERPDIRFKRDLSHIGVAVKRLWSQERAHKQLSDAAAQIEAAGVPGIVATNVQEYLETLPVVEDIDVRGAAFNEQVPRLHGQLPYLWKKPHVVGLMLCGTVAEWAEQPDGDRPRLRIATYNQLFTIANSDDERAAWDAFLDPIGERLRTWMKLNL